jgi:hypothetical protein
MRHSPIRDLPAARYQTVMRQLRIRCLLTAADKLGTSFIIARAVPDDRPWHEFFEGESHVRVGFFLGDDA